MAMPIMSKLAGQAGGEQPFPTGTGPTPPGYGGGPTVDDVD